MLTYSRPVHKLKNGKRADQKSDSFKICYKNGYFDVVAIGSFIVSERMIRPKALVAGGLALLLLHDLATHSNDPASLRIYRGK